MCSPASVKTRVIPTFCAINPERISCGPSNWGHAAIAGAEDPGFLEFDLDVDACGQVELHERIHRLRCRIDDVQQTLVCAHLELFAALLVDVWRAVHREPLNARWQRNGTAYLGARAFRRIHDLARRRIENAMIERFEPDTYVLAVHGLHSPVAVSASSNSGSALAR